MDKADLDVSADSSTADSGTATDLTAVEPGASADSPPATDAGTESSTEGASDPIADFNERANALEGEPAVEEPAESPTAKEAEAGNAAESDEPAAEQDEATTGKDNTTTEHELPQEQAESFNKRPEWQKVIKAVPPQVAKEVRAAMRETFSKLNALEKQVGTAKPAIETVARIRAAVGEDGISNTVNLIEGWQRGDEHAERILKELLADIQTRRGSVISSPELKSELQELEQQVSDGLLDEDRADKRRKELLELEQARAERKRQAEQQTEAQRRAAKQREQGLVAERTKAMNAWETGVSKSDVDYPKKQKFVIAEARRLVDEQQAKSRSLLSPQEMVAALDAAYKTVNADLGAILPKPKTRKVVTGGASSMNSRREPQNDRDAFNQAADALEARQ